MTTEPEADILDFLHNEGITLVGIAAADHLPSVPDEFSPHAVLKGAQSVICYAVPIPKGILYAGHHGEALYWRFCNMAYRSLDIISGRLASYLEEENCVTAPVYGCYPWKVRNREFWGTLPLVYWAEKAGIGTLTKCGLLAAPEFGTRILMGGVITTKRLNPTKRIRKELCPPGCVECLRACPVTAISETGKVDHNLCIRHSHENPLLQHLLHDKAEFSFETLVNTVGVDDHGTYLCFECMKACPLNK
ncbi:MAG: epoxyqueuosine reductase [Theionarchaea archaeon]|nr:epoxyqueuosine reductase [Theionarchaea archaeon]